MEKILISHGNGGEENSELVKEIFFKHFKNEILEKAEDASVVSVGKNIAVTTDTFIVSPLFFNGGDIGKLSICGTCNDLAMMGAKPLFVTCGFVIEEGFDAKKLETIVESMAKELAVNGAKIISGDTKVAPKGSMDGVFINTTGIGEVQKSGISCKNLTDGDIIIVSGNIGEHGSCIYATREGIELSGELKSDCASLWGVVSELLAADIDVKAMRDCTRGGMASSLNEWASSSGVQIEIDDASVPVSDGVRGICEILGFEPYTLACEGAFVLCVGKESVDDALSILRTSSVGRNAAIIGRVNSGKSIVMLKSSYGTRRVLDYPSGELLPRIC